MCKVDSVITNDGGNRRSIKNLSVLELSTIKHIQYNKL
jgi:hypothetical protein